MSAALFDPDAIMRAVRAAMRADPAATTATLRQTPGATVAMSQPSQGAARPKPTECRNVANVATGDAPIYAADEAAIEERAGLGADRIPAPYLDAWARLNCQKPFDVTDADWRRALDAGGLFLDQWGGQAAALGWTPGDLFDVRAGLIWTLAGRRAEAIGADHVRLSGGERIMLHAKHAEAGQ